MTQEEIDHAVAQHTGEDLDIIAQRGFSLADPLEVRFDPDDSAGRRSHRLQ